MVRKFLLFLPYLARVIRLKLRGIFVDLSSKVAGGASLRLTPAGIRYGSIRVGKSCEIGRGAVLRTFGGEISIGCHTFLGEYTIIYGHGGVTIGDHTLIAAQTCIVSSNHTVPGKETLIRSEPDILLPVTIGHDVWIGAGCKILGGVTIGDGCVVGAGSVVSRDLPPYSISVGVPAKVIRYRE
ncbi:acyltransferase [Mucilaginibacter ginsenosidivorans]|uniref:Acyltransferase n=1 Tax=Mucilaginibacter ginsenosidivorans TaxID=398053 RepID=A0A5B8UUW8_9SPHI|nr:acyltransferase [Mucilaginibacter ginsenosidivorans]QEC62565.1 acyltransferase [Mucilaginibacter ginsenosidivorans]